MEMLILLSLYIANALTSNALAYFVSAAEVVKLKPFNCYGCLSFWFSCIFGGVISALGSGLFVTAEAQEVVFYGGFFIAFLTGLLNYYFVKSKYFIYE